MYIIFYKLFFKSFFEWTENNVIFKWAIIILENLLHVPLLDTRETDNNNTVKKQNENNTDTNWNKALLQNEHITVTKPKRSNL